MTEWCWVWAHVHGQCVVCFLPEQKGREGLQPCQRRSLYGPVGAVKSTFIDSVQSPRGQLMTAGQSHEWLWKESFVLYSTRNWFDFIGQCVSFYIHLLQFSSFVYCVHLFKLLRTNSLKNLLHRVPTECKCREPVWAVDGAAAALEWVTFSAAGRWQTRKWAASVPSRTSGNDGGLEPSSRI